MANISNAFGEFTFNFTKTKQHFSNKEILEKLNLFAKQLLEPYYFTELDVFVTEEHLKEDFITIQFSASGRNAYYNNIAWFASDNEKLDFCKTLASFKDLELTINYTDYETGWMFVGSGLAQVNVINGEVSISQNDFDSEDLTLETWLSYDIGDESEYHDLME